MTSDPQDAFVLVVCPLCHTRMHPRREQVGGQIKCPDCGTVSPILPPPPKAPVRQRADAGEYGMRAAEEFGDPSATAVNVPLPRRTDEPAPPSSPSAGPQQNQPALILVTCPLCHTRMHPPRSDQGKRIKCPDCGTEVVVPKQGKPVARKPPPDLVAGHYDMGTAPEVAAPRVDLLLASQLPASRPAPVPPKWTMLSGVFSFPFQREAASRWLYLTIGLLLIGAIGVFAASGMDGSFGGIVAASALAAVILIMLIWILAFAAACLLTVIRETAAGIDVVEEWPDSDWREWLWPLLYILQVMALSAGFAYGLYWAVFLTGAGQMAAVLSSLAMAVLVFPVLLLSVIENGSALAFYSPPVLRSLVRLPQYWLLFHLETALPLAGIVALFVAGFPDWIFYAALVSAPLLAALDLIYARLLGRMAWHIGEMEHRRKEAEEERPSN